MADRHFITFRGETLSRAAWADRTGVSYACIKDRLKRGWSVEAALTTPMQERHGLSIAHPAEYGIWSHIHQRCSNPAKKAFRDYGGRGIKVCARWTGPGGFAAFLADMGPRPSPEHSVDRFPDTNGPYAPSNCRWATRTQQMRNTRSNRLLTVDGETRCVAEWAEILGVNDLTLRHRLHLGWSAERTIKTPVKRR